MALGEAVRDRPPSRFTGLPEDATVEGLPSALATADLGSEAMLLVGYRALGPLGGALADATALYACPAADLNPGVYPTGTPSADARRVYVATSGGSWWEGEVSW